MIDLCRLRRPRVNHWRAQALIALILGLSLLALCPPIPAHAQNAPIGIASNAVGTLVVVRTDGVEERLRGKGALALFEGDVLRTDAASRALIELHEGIQVGLNRNTTFRLLSRWEKAQGTTRIIRLKGGEIWVKTGEGPKQMEVETPMAIAAGREMEFFIEVVEDGNSILTVVQGIVEFGTAFGTCPIRTATVSYAVQGKKCTKPEPTDVKPIVAWTSAFTGSEAPVSLPLFWPPPDASTHHKIPRELLIAVKPAGPIWGSVAARMERALALNGYSDPGYYVVPKGFALVSQLERINEDATPFSQNLRWKIKVDPASIVPFSLAAYLKALLGKDAGFFRVIAFVFTPESILTSGTEPPMDEAKFWVGSGGTVLPQGLATQVYGVDMICTALVYEFEIPSHGAPARLRKPSNHNGQQHLKATKILQALGG